MLSAKLMGSFDLCVAGFRRALVRWKLLWDGMTSDFGAVDLCSNCSSKHSMDSYWVARRLVEVMAEGGKLPAYIENVSHPSTHELHEFLKSIF